MKLILKADVKNLGKAGSVVNVADGYARNYLIPNNLAVEAAAKNIKMFNDEKKKLETKTKNIMEEARELSERLSSISLTLTAKAGEENRLFGSITTMDIAEALKGKGLEIDRKKIILEEPIKRLGSYTAGVKVHPEITARISLTVVAE